MGRKSKGYKYLSLAEEMEKNGDTQESLAKAIGMSRQHLADKLHGKYEWKLRDIIAICDRYKKDCEELFKGEK